MATDFRLLTGFPEHHKTQKMIERLGTGSVYHWLCLLAWSAAHRTSGDFFGMTVEDIEIHAKWPKFVFKKEPFRGRQSRGLFIEVLIWSGFVESSEQGLKWHNWNENQPFVSKEQERIQKSRDANEAKRQKQKELEKAHKHMARADKIDEEQKFGSPTTGNEVASNSDLGHAPSLPNPSLPNQSQKQKLGAEAPFELPVWISSNEPLRKSWDAYVAMRKKSRTPLTEYAKGLTVLKLSKLKREGNDPIAVLEQSVMRTYRGVFEISEQSNGTNRVSKTSERASRNFDEGRRAAEEVLGLDHCEVNGYDEVPQKCGDDSGDVQDLRETSQRHSPTTIEGRVRSVPS